MHLAAKNGYIDIVEQFLLKGVSTKAMNEHNCNPYHLAAQGVNTSILELLLSEGASIEAMDEDKRTPFHWDAFMGCTAVMLLLMNGALIDSKSTDTDSNKYSVACCSRCGPYILR